MGIRLILIYPPKRTINSMSWRYGVRFASTFLIFFCFFIPTIVFASDEAEYTDVSTYTDDSYPNHVVRHANGVSSGGTAVVGGVYYAGQWLAYRWTASGLEVLGHLDSEENSSATAVSSDGSTVVGYSYSTSAGYSSQAYRWTSSGGMEGLGALEGGDTSHAYAVNSDGSVVVGESYSSSGTQAFRWKASTGTMEALGFMPGGNKSTAYGVSSDGSVVVGQGPSSKGMQAFRWTESTGMEELGFLEGGTSSYARAVSGDGAVVVGHASYPGNYQAFRWTTSGGMEKLGFMEGGVSSYAKSVSDDGSVIVGEGSSSDGSQAFRWTESSGMQSLRDLLIEQDVDMTGITLSDARGVSGDGEYIVGQAQDADGNFGFLVRYAADSGIITPAQFNQSLGTMGQVGPAVSNMGQLSMSRLGGVAGGQGMNFSINSPSGGAGTGTPSNAARQTGLSSGDEMPGSLNLWVIGSVGTNSELNGDDFGLHGGAGLTWERSEWKIGGGLFADSRNLETAHTGNQAIRAFGPGGFVTYIPENTDLEFRVSAMWQTVSLDLKRGYANGAGSATSEGSTDADVFGLSGRVQWTGRATDTVALTPLPNTHGKAPTSAPTKKAAGLSPLPMTAATRPATPSEPACAGISPCSTMPTPGMGGMEPPFRKQVRRPERHRHGPRRVSVFRRKSGSGLGRHRRRRILERHKTPYGNLQPRHCPRLRRRFRLRHNRNHGAQLPAVVSSTERR